MSASKSRVTPPPINHPTPTLWSDRVRGARESALDTETAISLACHLSGTFSKAKSWNELVSRLSERGFYLRFEATRLVLINEPTGAELCTCASLGHSFHKLALRLGKPSVNAENRRVILRPENT